VVTQRLTALVALLRILGLINFAAVVAVVAPSRWIVWCQELLGMGSFPTAPIAGYLARSTSLWFASFGVFLWFVSRDVMRYRSLIAFLGWAMVVQGLFMLGIDCAERMPGWWIVMEGPTCLLLGAAILRLVATVSAEIEPPRAGE
jgi:hypothetical protein